MLNSDLARTWKSTSHADKDKAMARAAIVLGNLVHYPISRKTYYLDDIEQLAANLVAFKQEE